MRAFHKSIKMTFLVILSVLLVACLLQEVFPFAVQPVKSIIVSRQVNGLTRKLQMAKKAEPPASESEYWQGEWVCADCGYVYDKDIDGGGLYFEQQKKGFICPQCSAPRKRYAKKVGDQWGVTRGILLSQNQETYQ